MNDRSALQHYCLEAMGITRWVHRVPLEKSAAYLLLIDHLEKESNNELSVEKQQLLERMCQALHWPKSATKTIFIENNPAALEQVISLVKPKKVLLFNIPSEKLILTPVIQIAILPTLQDLLRSPAAKKLAWQRMQSLIEM